MDEQMKAKLDGLFAAREAKLLAAEEAEARKKAEQQAKLQQFRTKRDEAIRPAMDEVSTYLDSRGITARITSSEYGADPSDGRRLKAEEVRMTIFLGGSSLGHENPYFAARFDPFSSSVDLSMSTIRPGAGGQSGSVGSFALEQINRQLIDRQLMSLLEAVIR